MRPLILLVTCLVSGMATSAQPTETLCDPVTNVCYCTGGWDSADCTAMKPLCEPGFWQACSPDGQVCSCTRNTWVHTPRAPGYDPQADLPEDRKARP